MKGGTNMKFAGKPVYVFVLLAITMVMKLAGNSTMLVTVGNSLVLNCPIKGQISMLRWTITPKAGGPCTLVYRTDKNMTHRTNCSDNIDWKFIAGPAAALEIQQVELAQEGNYSCEVASTDGNFLTMYHLTVLAPPRLSLYCDEQGSPVCEAAAGKPPAQLSWVPESIFSAEETGHHNGTVTVLSKFTACSTNVTNVTSCMVSHPAGNWSQSIACCPSEKTNFFLYAGIITCALIIITLLAVIYYLKLHIYRPCYKTKPPEIAPIHSQQDDTMEVEPYTTYVQKENVIYNSVSDLTVGQNLPQDLCSET
ncbi:PREDICTED: cell surface glycoprotein CD200 receptor 1 [Pseudopodoces humilis]|uniref:cell surface glycoprotein CD200 receptor 1 n=1 Tax=Pseudopodoces humilis TaxID=181119 RepID=UPI000395C147|nr:PREDICTED: cell surface glycoprotein CD200 receptor 1 [Pseudopodoces humilis]